MKNKFSVKKEKPVEVITGESFQSLSVRYWNDTCVDIHKEKLSEIDYSRPIRRISLHYSLDLNNLTEDNEEIKKAINEIVEKEPNWR